MSTFAVPEDLEGLKGLFDISRLLLAKEWERAAVVYAFTEVGGPRNTASHTPQPPKVNIRQFAALGLVGLSSVKAVVRYRRVWERAMAEGLVTSAEPGELVVLPDGPFPAWNDVMEEYVEEDPTEVQRQAGVISALYSALRSVDKAQRWTGEITIQDRQSVLLLINRMEEALRVMREQYGD
jgi:hypothetical protein